MTETLAIRLRERNQLLLAAGHTPAFLERAFDDPELAPVREALRMGLARHEPYPAIVVDRAWNLVAADPAVAALSRGIDIDA